jgi:hypothetical protein
MKQELFGCCKLFRLAPLLMQLFAALLEQKSQNGADVARRLWPRLACGPICRALSARDSPTPNAWGGDQSCSRKSGIGGNLSTRGLHLIIALRRDKLRDRPMMTRSSGRQRVLAGRSGLFRGRRSGVYHCRWDGPSIFCPFGRILPCRESPKNIPARRCPRVRSLAAGVIGPYTVRLEQPGQEWALPPWLKSCGDQRKK